MKKILVAVIILGMNITAFAINKEDKAVKAKFKVEFNEASKRAHLTFVPAGNEKVIVKFLDENGEVIFQEQIKQSASFERPYNLSKLSAANYTMVVSEGQNTFTKNISLVTESTPELSKFKVTAQKVAEGKVALKVLQEEVSTVFVSVKNLDGKVLYSTAVSDHASFIQNFDLTQVKEDVYFEVRTSNSVKTIEL